MDVDFSVSEWRTIYFAVLRWLENVEEDVASKSLNDPNYLVCAEYLRRTQVLHEKLDEIMCTVDPLV